MFQEHAERKEEAGEDPGRARSLGAISAHGRPVPVQRCQGLEQMLPPRAEGAAWNLRPAQRSRGRGGDGRAAPGVPGSLSAPRGLCQGLSLWAPQASSSPEGMGLSPHTSGLVSSLDLSATRGPPETSWSWAELAGAGGGRWGQWALGCAWAPAAPRPTLLLPYCRSEHLRPCSWVGVTPSLEPSFQ